MAGADWYAYLAATNLHIVATRSRIERQKGCIDDSKHEGRGTADFRAQLRSLEEALQLLTVRRERILKWLRAHPLPDRGAAMSPMSADGSEQRQYAIDRIRCPTIKGLPRDTVHILHKSLVDIVRMRMSVELAGVQLKRSHRSLRETNDLLERVRTQGF